MKLLLRMTCWWVALAALRAAAAPSGESFPWNWPGYQVILWVGQSADQHPEALPEFIRRAREMGVTAVSVQRESDPNVWIRGGLRFYVENSVNRGLCLKWNSAVRDWDGFITRWNREGRHPEAFVREPSLDDPAWQSWAIHQMRNVAHAQGVHHPLAYDIRDELSTTCSANPFDYDFSPVALEGFRGWLKGEYADLESLNREWETRFATWDSVRPYSTDEIKARMASGRPAVTPGAVDWGALARLEFEGASPRGPATRWNFSPWADFRTYMDVSLARVLGHLREEAHAFDPQTPVGIEGTQMPHAFGGYDLARLSRVVDWVEPYDVGNAREIFGSFMPSGLFLTTVGESSAQVARRRLWHLLLMGDRGCLIWWSENCLQWGASGWELTERARSLAPVLKEFSSPRVQALMRAERESDPILLHYSQPSLQVDWLLESMGDGATWQRRFSSYEADHNLMLRGREVWLRSLQDLGYSPRFATLNPAAPDTNALVVVAQSMALADAELNTLRALPPRHVIVDPASGAFDGHGRLRPPGTGTLPGGVRSPVAGLRDVAALAGERASPSPGARWREWMQWLQKTVAGVPRAVEVPWELRVRTCRLKLPRGRVLAFERNLTYASGETLKDAGRNPGLDTAVEIPVRLAIPAHVYDLQTGRYLGLTDRFQFTLDPGIPSLFAACPARLEGDRVDRLWSSE